MIETIGLAVALVLALVDLVRSRLDSMVAWACVIGFGVLFIVRIG